MTAISSSRPRITWIALAAAAVLMTGCAEPARSPGSRERVFAADLAGGARNCEAPKPDLADGQTADAAMKVGNDGGWCGILLQRRGRPYDSSLLTDRPAHGKVAVIRVGDATRIGYTPTAGFAGADNFAVKLIPGDVTLRVAVTVTPR